MYQFNLNSNDIIIIIVLYSIFCIYLYITNTQYTKESFDNNVVLVNSNDNKQNVKKTFGHFFELFEKHIITLNDINEQSISIINKFNNTNTNINTNLNNINNFLDLVTINEEFKETLPIDIEFNSLFTNINELFTTHKNLFNNPNDDVSFRDWNFIKKTKKWINEESSVETFYGESSKDSDLCYVLNLDKNDPINFYYNLSNQLDVIQTKNKSQLKLIKINIDNIKSIINTINDILVFDSKISSEIIETLDQYYNLLDTLYNKDSVNIYNVIYKNINRYTNCEKEIIFDKLKLEDIRVNIKNIILKSFKKLNGDFKYYDLDQIFIRTYKPNDHFKETKAGLKLWQTFCEKLKKLNKPNKQNLILKKFNLDLIEKKKIFINKLEDNIYDIQDKMTYDQLDKYNINKLRTHEQAIKQYEAIKKGIDNIKNKNKIKINLT